MPPITSATRFAAPDGTAVLFSADHVMSWNSSIVSPPDGDMSAYFGSLKRVLDRDDDVFLPGHGPSLPEPRLTRALLFHGGISLIGSILKDTEKRIRSTIRAASSG